jgi:peptidoglycan-N-acetylglucosamine deacetylase
MMGGATATTKECRWCARLDRRAFFGAATAGLAILLAGCAKNAATVGVRRHRAMALAPTTTTTSLAPVVRLDDIPAPHPGSPRTIFEGPGGTNQVAVTIDDGFCAQCARFYVSLARVTGIHLTFSPNGVYHSIWDPLAPVLRPLIESGQVQIGNHTYNHYNLLDLSNAGVVAQITENETWIEDTFGITARPWFRPPYGVHNARTDAIAGDLGYTNILMWNGSFGDSTPISPRQLLSLANQYLQPGTIMLGHANYPTIEALWGEIQALIEERGLAPVTLDEMFGTTRAEG